MTFEAAVLRLAEAIEAQTAFFQNNNAQGPVIVPSPAPAPEAKAKKTAAKPKDVKKEEPVPAPVEVVDDVAAKYKIVQAAILDFNRQHGRPALEKLLAEFGASNGPSLKPEQYDEFIARAAAGPVADDNAEDLT